MAPKRNLREKRPHILSIMIILVIAAGVVFLLTSNKPDDRAGLPGVGSTDGTNPQANPSNSSGEPGVISPSVSPTTAPATTPAISPTVITEPTQPPSPTQAPTAAPVPSQSAPENIDALKNDLEGYIAKQAGKYGLYYKNLVTGEAFGINDKDEYIAASTTKLPMNLLLYKKIASGEVDFNNQLVYKKEDFEAGSGIIQKQPYGTEYTVRETARLSIVYSDNCGINMIIRLLGIDNIRKYMQDLGGTIYYGKRHRTCPYDLALYTEELYRFYQESPEVAGLLIEDLQNTQWNDRINKFLPDDVKVSHKIGNYEKVYNDVGIVFAKEPYVLAVMSDNIDQSVASNCIAELSLRIYNYVEK